MDGLAGSFLAVAEMMGFCTAGLILFRKWEFTLAEAASGAIMACVMLLSLFYQIKALPVIGWMAVGIELLLCAGSFILILKNRKPFAENVGMVFFFIRRHLFVAFLFLALWAVLFFQAIFAVSDADLFYKVTTAPFADPFFKQEGVAFQFNTIILAHHFLRFNTVYGLGIFGFMAHLSIGFSTYALSRRYAWPPTAVTVALMVVSMPRLVVLGTASGSELMPAAAALFSIVLLFRFLEEPDLKDLVFFIFAVLFSVTDPGPGMMLPILLVLLFLVVVIRRHGMVMWKEILSGNTAVVALSVFPTVIFSQVYMLAAKAFSPGESLFKAFSVPVLYNQKGIFGAFDNLVRYTLESIHLTAPVEKMMAIVTGTRVCEALNRVYVDLIAGLFSGHGQGLAFHVACADLPGRVWFGPVAVIIVIPSFLYTMWRGPRRLKAVSIAFAAYLYLVALIVQWHPLNVKYFTAFFACIGFTASFLLPPWRLSTNGKTVLQVISSTIFAIGLYTNFYTF